MTLTKEWLLKTIAELEEERDAVPGAVNEDAAMALAAMKIALASLEAEPVVFRSKLKPPSAIGSENWDYTDHRQPDAFELESCVIERLYTAPPAPVTMPTRAKTKPPGKTSQSRYSTTGSGAHLPRRIVVALSVVMQASFCTSAMKKTGTFRLPKGEGCRRFPWHGPDR
ncbi:Uncharacterised protein [Enterobacter hormaechei]|nr:Uncharacterised protein [Enterobacter hormaechei]